MIQGNFHFGLLGIGFFGTSYKTIYETIRQKIKINQAKKTLEKKTDNDLLRVQRKKLWVYWTEAPYLIAAINFQMSLEKADIFLKK